MVKSIISAVVFQFIFPISLFVDKVEEGTIILVAVGSDGVILASDSRAFMRTTFGKPYKYKDSVAKIFIVNNLPIANSGSATFGDGDISQVIKEYEKSGLLSTDLPIIFYLL